VHEDYQRPHAYPGSHLVAGDAAGCEQREAQVGHPRAGGAEPSRDHPADHGNDEAGERGLRLGYQLRSQGPPLDHARRRAPAAADGSSSGSSTQPAMKPPMWAHHAMPAASANGDRSSPAPWNTWMKNQMPANTRAGMLKNSGMKRIGTITRTQA